MLYKIFIIIMVFSFLSPSSCSRKGKEPPRVDKGVIDLTGWDFTKDGPIKLNGEWEFYWKTFIHPSQCISGALPQKKYYFNVPSVWSSYATRRYPQFEGLHKGYGTLMIKIKGLSIAQGEDLALMLKAMQSTYSLYFIPGTAVPGIISNSIAPTPLLKNGVVATSRKEEIPQYLSQHKRISSCSDVNFVVMHISNYYYSNIAFSRELVLGTEHDVQSMATQKRLFSFFVIGIILFMAVYHILLFSFNRKNVEYLIFGLICFFISVWYLLWDGYVGELVPEPLYTLNVIIENATSMAYSIVLPLFALFFRRLFKNEIPFSLVVSAWSVTLVYWIIRIFKLPIDSYAFFYYNMLIIVAVIIGLFVLARAVINKRQGALLSLFGFIIFGITVSRDILQANLILFTDVLITPFGLVAYILAQSLVFTKTYSSLAEKAEVATFELIQCKYKKTYLSGIDIDLMKGRLKELMENDKLYREEALSMGDLAQKMSLSSHQLSELLNIVLNANFSNYINSYRVQEAKILLREDITRAIISIAYDVGFKSSTSFYRAFKNHTGITPQEFRCME